MRSFFLQVLRWHHKGKVMVEMTLKVTEARFKDESFEEEENGTSSRGYFGHSNTRKESIGNCNTLINPYYA